MHINAKSTIGQDFLDEYSVEARESGINSGSLSILNGRNYIYVIILSFVPVKLCKLENIF